MASEIFQYQYTRNVDKQVWRHDTTARCCSVCKCSMIFYSECLELISGTLYGISTNIKHLHITDLFLRVLAFKILHKSLKIM
jgi:hypothetical protein